MAYKLPSGKYRAQPYLGKDPETGQKIYASIVADTKEEAEKAAEEFKRKYSLKKKPAIVSDGWTLERAFEEYIWIKDNGNSYCSINKNAFKDIRNIEIGKITQDDIDTAISLERTRTISRRHEDKSISPKTLKNEIGFLRAVLRCYLPQKEFTYDNPSVPSYKKKKLPRPREIWKALRPYRIPDYDLELAVLLAMWLNLSQSEILGLSKFDISKDVNLLFVRRLHSKDGRQIIYKELPKGHKQNRFLIIPDFIQEYILGVVSISGEYDDTDMRLVPLTKDQLYTRFKKLMKKAGLDVSFKDLFQIAKNIAKEAGVPKEEILRRSGSSLPHVAKRPSKKTIIQSAHAIDEIMEKELEIERNL